jgi:hypothetical protein
MLGQGHLWGGERRLKWVRWRVMGCKSANEPAWVRVWDIIHAADDGLVGLKGSIGSVEVSEVLLRLLLAARKSVHDGTSMKTPDAKNTLDLPYVKRASLPICQGWSAAHVEPEGTWFPRDIPGLSIVRIQG